MKYNTNLNKYKKELSYPYNEIKSGYKNNIILGENLFYGFDTRKTRRSANTFIIGTKENALKHIYEPNILQANCNYIIYDKDGYLYTKYKLFLKNQGYMIGIINKENNMKYDEFNYQILDNNKSVLFIIGECNVENIIYKILEQLYNLAESYIDLKQLNHHFCIMINNIDNVIISNKDILNKMIVTCRKYNISFMLNVNSIKNINILDTAYNCDNFIVLNLSDNQTNDYIRKRLSYRIKRKSYSKIKIFSKEKIILDNTITIDDIYNVKNNQCLISTRGYGILLIDKYDINKHPNFKYIE